MTHSGAGCLPWSAPDGWNRATCPDEMALYDPSGCLLAAWRRAAER